MKESLVTISVVVQCEDKSEADEGARLARNAVRELDFARTVSIVSVGLPFEVVEG